MSRETLSFWLAILIRIVITALFTGYIVWWLYVNTHSLIPGILCIVLAAISNAVEIYRDLQDRKRWEAEEVPSEET